MSEPLKLLVVDDHNLFRRGLIGLMNDQPDFRVVGEVANGQDAILACRQLQPDVVLLDVHMPGGSGIDALQVIKKETKARVLMLTVSNNDQDLLGALAAGADGYLLKNAEPEHLCQAIRQLVTGQGALSPEILSQVMRAAGLAHNLQSTTVLSRRECEIMGYLAQGATTAEIATTLVISKNTVKTHIRRILNKLEVANRAEAVARASVLGLIPPANQ